MKACPYLKDPEIASEFNEMVDVLGEDAAYLIWSLNKGHGIKKAPDGSSSDLYTDIYKRCGNEKEAMRIMSEIYTGDFMDKYGDWTGDYYADTDLQPPENTPKDFTLSKQNQPILNDLLNKTPEIFPEDFIREDSLTKLVIEQIKNIGILIHGRNEMEQYLKDHKIDEVTLYIGKKARVLFKAQLMKRRPDLSESVIDASLDRLHQLSESKENTAFIKAIIHWMSSGSIVDLDRDYRVAELIYKACKNRHADILKYKTLSQLLQSPEMTPTRHDAHFDPNEESTFKHERTEKIDGRTFEVYDVEDSKDGMAAVCRALYANYEGSPWCLSTFTTTGKPTESAWNYWLLYPAIPRKIAFENGKPVAFSSANAETNIKDTSHKTEHVVKGEAWWDLDDKQPTSTLGQHINNRPDSLLQKKAYNASVEWALNNEDSSAALIQDVLEAKDDIKRLKERLGDNINIKTFLHELLQVTTIGYNDNESLEDYMRDLSMTEEWAFEDPEFGFFVSYADIIKLADIARNNGIDAAKSMLQDYYDYETYHLVNNISDSIDVEEEQKQSLRRQRLAHVGLIILPAQGDHEEDLQHLIDAGVIDDPNDFFKTPSGEVYGFVTPDGQIYLDESVINPEHPMHEYTHIWDRVVSKTNKELWLKGIELMKQIPMWNAIANDQNYGLLWEQKGVSKEQLEFNIASEVHARIVGENGKILLDAVAKTKGYSNIIDKLKSWMLDFWKELKSTFSTWTKDEINELTLDLFNNMTVRDFADGIKLNDSFDNDGNFETQHYIETRPEAKELDEEQLVAYDSKEAVILEMESKGIDPIAIKKITGREGIISNKKKYFKQNKTQQLLEQVKAIAETNLKLYQADQHKILDKSAIADECNGKDVMPAVMDYGEDGYYVTIIQNVTTSSPVDWNDEKILTKASEIRPIIDAMRAIFPDIQVELVTDKDDWKYNPRTKLMKNKVVSYYDSDEQKIYINMSSNEITKSTIIEEFLHPFVWCIAKQNYLLFDRLYDSCLRLYPLLSKEIRKHYLLLYNYEDKNDKDGEISNEELRQRCEVVTEILATNLSKNDKKQLDERKLSKVGMLRWSNLMYHMIMSNVESQFHVPDNCMLSVFLEQRMKKQHKNLANITLDEFVDLLRTSEKAYRFGKIDKEVLKLMGDMFHISKLGLSDKDKQYILLSKLYIVKTMQELNNVYSRWVGKTVEKEKVLARLYERLEKIKAADDLDAIPEVLDFLLQLFGVNDVNNTSGIDKSTAWGWLYDLSKNGFKDVTAEKLLNLKHNNIDFAEDLFRGVFNRYQRTFTANRGVTGLAYDPIVQSKITLLRASITATKDLYYQALYNVVFKAIDRYIEDTPAYKQLTQQQRDNMKQNWKELIVGDNTFLDNIDMTEVGMFINGYDNSNNWIIGFAFSLIYGAESKTQTLHIELSMLPMRIYRSLRLKNPKNWFSSSFLKKMIEHDRDGNLTGFFRRKFNYGLFLEDRDNFMSWFTFGNSSKNKIVTINVNGEPTDYKIYNIQDPSINGRSVTLDDLFDACDRKSNYRSKTMLMYKNLVQDVIDAGGFVNKYGYLYIFLDGEYVNSATGEPAEDEEWTQDPNTGIWSPPPFYIYKAAKAFFEGAASEQRYLPQYYFEQMSRPLLRIPGPLDMAGNVSRVSWENLPHGLSPITRKHYDALTSVQNFYLDHCTGDDGITRPQNLSPFEREKLRLIRDEILKYCSFFDNNGNLKAEPELLECYQIALWNQFLSSLTTSTHVKLLLFDKERQDAKDAGCEDLFLEFNSKWGISQSLMSLAYGNGNGITVDEDMDPLLADAILKGKSLANDVAGLYSNPKSKYKKYYTVYKDLELRENCPSYWAYCRTVDNIKEGLRDRSKKSGSTFTPGKIDNVLLPHYKDGTLEWEYKNKTTGATIGQTEYDQLSPQDKQDYSIYTYYQYMIDKYFNMYRDTGVIPGLDPDTLNDLNNCLTEVEAYRIIAGLFTYMKSEYNPDANEWGSQKPHPIEVFYIKLPSKETQKDYPVDYLPKGLFIERESELINPNYDKSLQQLFIPSNEYLDKDFEKDMKSLNTTIDGTQYNLYDELIKIMKYAFKLNKMSLSTFDYKLPDVIGEVPALLSRGELHSTIKQLAGITTDDEMTRVSGTITTGFNTNATLINRRYVLNEQTNTNAITSDVTSAVLQYLGAAINYDNKSKVMPLVNALRDGMSKEARESYASEHGTAYQTSENAEKFFDRMLQAHVYETIGNDAPEGNTVGVEQASSITKHNWLAVYKVYSRIATSEMLGFNYLSAGTGIVDSIISSVRDILTFYDTPLSAVFGIGYGIIHLIPLLLNYSNSVPLAYNKLLAIMLRFGISRTSQEVVKNVKRGKLKSLFGNPVRTGLLIYSSLDYFWNGIMLPGFMASRVYIDNGVIPKGFYMLGTLVNMYRANGLNPLKAVFDWIKNRRYNLYSAYYFDRHTRTLKIKPFYKDCLTNDHGFAGSDQESLFRAFLNNRFKLNNGMAPDDLKVYAQTSLIGSMFTALRYWLVNVVQNYFSGGYSDTVRRDFKNTTHYTASFEYGHPSIKRTAGRKLRIPNNQQKDAERINPITGIHNLALITNCLKGLGFILQTAHSIIFTMLKMKKQDFRGANHTILSSICTLAMEIGFLYGILIPANKQLRPWMLSHVKEPTLQIDKIAPGQLSVDMIKGKYTPNQVAESMYRREIEDGLIFYLIQTMIDRAIISHVEHFEPLTVWDYLSTISAKLSAANYSAAAAQEVIKEATDRSTKKPDDPVSSNSSWQGYTNWTSTVGHIMGWSRNLHSGFTFYGVRGNDNFYVNQYGPTLGVETKSKKDKTRLKVLTFLNQYNYDYDNAYENAKTNDPEYNELNAEYTDLNNQLKDLGRNYPRSVDELTKDLYDEIVELQKKVADAKKARDKRSKQLKEEVDLEFDNEFNAKSKNNRSIFDFDPRDSESSSFTEDDNDNQNE